MTDATFTVAEDAAVGTLLGFIAATDDGAAPLVVVNNTHNRAAAHDAFSAFKKTCESFLSFTPVLAGIVQRDDTIPAAIRAQTLVAIRSPQSGASRDLDALAGTLARGKEAA